ncbi:GNAT family N-acetyltransferase [Abyssibius alkaniclasticus]|uniref:GNAT family N-acetyltransferase n=1 Tax=Abyssibius alkaniclasticus TaxID=2881234 RepID=UPI0040592CC3
MSVLIDPARSDDDIAEVTRLAWEFVAFLKDRYPERIAQIDEYLERQRFVQMLADFRSYFNPPKGECVLARLEGVGVGIVMLKPVQGELCEMNRMFVTPKARGYGVGRRLCTTLFDRARALGYRQMRLGALDRHDEALGLYRSLGFEPDPEPDEHAANVPGVISLRMHLL